MPDKKEKAPEPETPEEVAEEIAEEAEADAAATAIPKGLTPEQWEAAKAAAKAELDSEAAKTDQQKFEEAKAIADARNARRTRRQLKEIGADPRGIQDTMPYGPPSLGAGAAEECEGCGSR